jgi:hypothetical protein
MHTRSNVYAGEKLYVLLTRGVWQSRGVSNANANSYNMNRVMS